MAVAVAVAVVAAAAVGQCNDRGWGRTQQWCGGGGGGGGSSSRILEFPQLYQKIITSLPSSVDTRIILELF